MVIPWCPQEPRFLWVWIFILACGFYPQGCLWFKTTRLTAITLEMPRWRSKRDLSLLSQLCVSSHSLRPSYYCLHLTSRISSHSHTWLLVSSGNRVYIPGHSCRKEGREDSCQLHCGSDVHITWEGGVFGGISVHGALFCCGWVLNFFILINQQKNKQYF